MRARLNALFAHLTWLRYEAVSYCRDEWWDAGESTSAFDLYKVLTECRKGSRAARQWGVQPQRSILKRVHEGYKKLFASQGKRPRLRKNVRSFESDGPVNRSGDRYYVSVKGVGKLRFRDKQGVLETATVKHWRIVRHALGSGYDIQLVIETDERALEPDTRAAVGIDFGLKAVCTLSNGTQYQPEHISDARERKLSRKLSKAIKGSRSRRKKKLARQKEMTRNRIRCKNACHRITSDIIQNHSANLVLEDLQIANLMRKGGNRKRGLNRSFAGKSLGTVKLMLEQKALRANGRAVRVPAAYTSQTCARCGNRKTDLKLSDRTYVCICGYRADRDVNAARNVLSQGLSLEGWESCLRAGENGRYGAPLERLTAQLSTPTAQNHMPVQSGI